MKRFLIVPSLVLAVLLALCILNAAALNRRTSRWMDQADRIADLAEQERWDMAREAMDDLSADWESAQDFLHVVIHHETLDAAQVTLTRCRTLCRLRQGDEGVADRPDRRGGRCRGLHGRGVRGLRLRRGLDGEPSARQHRRRGQRQAEAAGL